MFSCINFRIIRIIVVFRLFCVDVLNNLFLNIGIKVSLLSVVKRTFVPAYLNMTFLKSFTTLTLKKSIKYIIGSYFLMSAPFSLSVIYDEMFFSLLEEKQNNKNSFIFI